MSFFDAALPESNYMANGFTAGFLINCFSSVIEAPDGYSERAINDILSGYESTPAKEDFSSPNIILVLGESFWDVTKLEGAEFLNADGTEEIDPISNYHALCERDDVYTGSFFTTAFGGGTVRPEFEVMTGLTTDYLPSGKHSVAVRQLRFRDVCFIHEGLRIPKRNASSVSFKFLYAR